MSIMGVIGPETPESRKRKIGGRIRYIRECRCMSMEDLAISIGVAHATLSGIERGLQSLKAECIAPLCEALNATPEQILGIDLTLKIGG